MMTRKTAILVDGGYYRKRATDLWGKQTPHDRAKELFDYCMLHITVPDDPRDLYRIFYYDCPPMKRKMTHPLTNRIIDFSVGSGTKWTENFFDELSSKRKVALRMGELAEGTATYQLKPQSLSDLLSNARNISSLVEDDFILDVKQKGVDMRIGLDIAALSKDRLVDQIVLIAGDSDFLPVAKLARRSGIDFILDPMATYRKKTFLLHVDGLETYTNMMYPPAPAPAPANSN